MIQENLNLVVLHNISSVKEDNGVKVFYPFSQDIEIIRSIKKLNYNMISCFYDDDFIKNLKNNSLVFNLCDGFENPEDEIALIQTLEKNKIPYISAEISMLPQSTIKLEGKNAEQMIKLMEALEEHEDVQKVYANFDIEETLMEKLSA